MTPYQVFNLVDDDTFQSLEKDIIRLLPGKVDMFLEPIKTFDRNRIGNFATVCEQIYQLMISRNFKNPKINRIGIIKNNRKHVPFHLHPSLGTMNPILRKDFGKHVIPLERAFVAVFYCHNIPEPKYQGVLGVKRFAKDRTGFTFPATPNSIIIHDGTYGHDADVEEIHPSISRSSCYTHWTVDP